MQNRTMLSLLSNQYVSSFFFLYHVREVLYYGAEEVSDGVCLCLILEHYWEPSDNHHTFTIVATKLISVPLRKMYTP